MSRPFFDVFFKDINFETSTLMAGKNTSIITCRYFNWTYMKAGSSHLLFSSTPYFSLLPDELIWRGSLKVSQYALYLFLLMLDGLFPQL